MIESKEIEILDKFLTLQGKVKLYNASDIKINEQGFILERANGPHGDIYLSLVDWKTELNLEIEPENFYTRSLDSMIDFLSWYKINKDSHIDFNLTYSGYSFSEKKKDVKFNAQVFTSYSILYGSWQMHVSSNAAEALSVAFIKHFGVDFNASHTTK